MLFIDKKYVSFISPKLDRFKQKGEYLWNFRCPICGDSSKNKYKARGYIYRRKDSLFFTCHNCGASMSFGNFLKLVDPHYHKEYKLDKYVSGNTKIVDQSSSTDWTKIIPVFTKKINLPTINSLPDKHIAKAYILARKIPEKYHGSVYYAEDFAAFLDQCFPNHGNKIPQNEKRIVVPFYDEKNILLGIQARALSNSAVRYITVKSDESYRKVFGLDTIDFTKRIYVVEGPFDSMFLDNSIALMDALLYRAITMVGDYDYVFIYDNENRNKEIVRNMLKTVDLGKKICVWPKNIKPKDINDMILSGYSASEIQAIIDANTFEGVRARLEIETWKKI